MPLAPFTPENVLDLAERLDAVALKLKTLRQDMGKKGPEVFDVPWDKAEAYVDYLEGWSQRCADRHKAKRREIEKEAKRNASETRAALKGKRPIGRPKKNPNTK